MLASGLGAAALLCKEQGVLVFPICMVYELVYNTPLLEVIRRYLQSCCCRKGEPTSGDKEHRFNHQEALPGGTGTALRLGWLVLSLSVLVKKRWDVMGSGMRATGFTEWQNPAAAHPDWSVRLLSLNYYFGRHMLLLVWPLPPFSELCHDWSGDSIPLILTAADPRNLLALSVYGCCAGFACLATFPFSSVVVSPRDRRVLVIVGALLLTPFVLSANLLVTVGFVVAERVMYMPSIGICILYGWLGARFLSASTSCRHSLLSSLRRGVVGLALAAMLGGCAWRTWDRNTVWRDKRALFEAGLRVVPVNPRMHYDLGVLLLEEYDKEVGSGGGTDTVAGAQKSFENAIALCPFHSDAMINKVSYDKQGGL
jgi:hypothetical protein